MFVGRRLKKKDRVAVVSLSSGMLGENFCSHNLEIGSRRLREYGLEPVFMPNALKGIAYLKEHPEARASDLKQAFLDDSIAGVICAIGGDDTYRLLPYLMEDVEFIQAVQKKPKLFTGFSDTTVNHLMFYKLGMRSYYGPNFICDLADIGDDMLPYSRRAFERYLEGYPQGEIVSSDLWYEERKDFSRAALGTERIAHKEERGFELLQGAPLFSGRLLGGCLESLYEVLTSSRHGEEPTICEKYEIFPAAAEWKGKILFVETSEAQPEPAQVEEALGRLKTRGVFRAIAGILVGKPMDEVYYEEYKAVYRKVVNDASIPIVYNVNFGHATPRCVLPYGAEACVDMEKKIIHIKE